MEERKRKRIHSSDPQASRLSSKHAKNDISSINLSNQIAESLKSKEKARLTHVPAKPRSSRFGFKSDFSPKNSVSSSVNTEKNPYITLIEAEEKKEAEISEEGDVVQDSGSRRQKILKKGLHFNVPGKFKRIGDHVRILENKRLRAEERKRKDARRHFRQPVTQTDESKATSLQDKGDIAAFNENDLVVKSGWLSRANIQYNSPVEWWDEVYLNPEGTESSIKNLKQKEFKFIEHSMNKLSILLKPRKQKSDEAMPLVYTKKERKKLKHQRKMAKIKFIQEQIAMGLMKAPPNKESLKTMMKTINYDKDIGAVINPSAKEKEILGQVELRKDLHEARNEARKKTPAEKWRNKLAKISKDKFQSGEVAVAVYSVENLSTPISRAASLKYKLDVNAQKMMINGLVLEVVRFEDKKMKKNLIIVEGGPKRIYEFDKLMKRLDWTSIPVDKPKQENEEAEEKSEIEVEEVIREEDKPNSCTKLWMGFLPNSTFPNFVFETVETEAHAERFLRDKKLEAFWR